MMAFHNVFNLHFIPNKIEYIYYFVMFSVKCLFMSFVRFSIDLFLLVFCSSLYSLYANCWLYV